MNTMRKLVILIMLSCSWISAHAAEAKTLLNQPLPATLTDKELLMSTVELAPGESSQPHRHNAYVMVYMLSGQLDMQVAGKPLVQLKPGDTFYEAPDDIHSVSHNRSSSVPAKFVVYILKDRGAPVSVPAN